MIERKQLLSFAAASSRFLIPPYLILEHFLQKSQTASWCVLLTWNSLCWMVNSKQRNHSGGVRTWTTLFQQVNSPWGQIIKASSEQLYFFLGENVLPVSPCKMTNISSCGFPLTQGFTAPRSASEWITKTQNYNMIIGQIKFLLKKDQITLFLEFFIYFLFKTPKPHFVIDIQTQYL